MTKNRTKRILEITLSNPLVSQRRKQRFPKGQELLKSKMICDKNGNRPQTHMLPPVLFPLWRVSKSQRPHEVSTKGGKREVVNRGRKLALLNSMSTSPKNALPNCHLLPVITLPGQTENVYSPSKEVTPGGWKRGSSPPAAARTRHLRLTSHCFFSGAMPLAHRGMHAHPRRVMESHHNRPHPGVKGSVPEPALTLGPTTPASLASLPFLRAGNCYSVCRKCCSPRYPHGSLHRFHLGLCSNGCSSKKLSIITPAT